MDCSKSGFPVHHQSPEIAQTHVNQVSDAIQPSHHLSSPSPPAFNLSQHQGLFQSQFFTSGGQSIGVSASASVLPMNIQDWFPLEWAGWISRVSPTPQFKCTVLGHLSWFLLEWRFKNRLVMWYNSAEVFLPSFFNIRKFGLWYNSCMISSQPTQPLWASVSSYVE